MKFIKAKRMNKQLGSLSLAEENTLCDKLQRGRNELDLSLLNTRLGRAGVLTSSARAQFIRNWTLVSVVVICGIIAVAQLRDFSFAVQIVMVVIAAYVLLLACVISLKSKAVRFEREILFSLPLTVEQLLLLVSSGLGPIPAVRELISNETKNPIEPFLSAIYRRAEEGILFQDALAEMAEQTPFVPLKHFFLYLETSIAQGAELSTSLRQLSEHIHTEWNVTVEGVVRRLESAVVFPVFISVIGLMLLVAAVPIVPLLELSGNLQAQQAEIQQKVK